MTDVDIPLCYARIAQQAAASIAPAWPLDQSIAVNPWWAQRHERIEQTFAEQAVLTGETSLMDKSYYREHWSKSILPQHVSQAITELGAGFTLAQLEEDIQRRETSPAPRWKTLAMLMDQEVPSAQGHSWGQEIVQQVSQFIALYHQYPERFHTGDNHPQQQDGEHLYQSWLEVVARDKGIQTLLGVDLLSYFRDLPGTISALFGQMSLHWRDVWITEDGSDAYMRACLHQLSGWAGWQSWLNWQAKLEKQPAGVSHTYGLTAILLAWDHVLMQWLQQNRLEAALKIRQLIRYQASNIQQFYHLARQQQSPLWVWQRALELSVQQPFIEQVKSVQTKPAPARPEMQAVFCIDVRSEPMRRALEAQDSGIETLGFAGFFGIPVAYQTQDGSLQRPQLPGLLAPALVARQTRMQPERWMRLTKLGWQNSLDKPSSNLGMIEAGGLLKLVSLFKRVILQNGTDNPVDRGIRHNTDWELSHRQNNAPLSRGEKAELGAGILKAMGISKRLARVVLLTGHASQTCNNHTASGLDCGACGGQSGELNVKILADLLNDATVRSAMREYGVRIPQDTHFYAALHNTTTDDLTVFNAPQAEWKVQVNRASEQARILRTGQFSAPESLTTSKAKRFFHRRATNWAQMRPEWGLCNNAAVFIAPRALTRDLDLAGRAFLHEYHVSQDPEFNQLEKIMTAPLLVMNWINLQYYASVTTPNKYGSGNKLLHNVVGGHIGVFEGNGGDLRIGLSHQSVHDGTQYRHQPVRLSAFIQAPKTAIEAIIARHPDVAALVNNGWLFLYQLDDQQQVWQYQAATPHGAHWQIS